MRLISNMRECHHSSALQLQAQIYVGEQKINPIMATEAKFLGVTKADQNPMAGEINLAIIVRRIITLSENVIN